MGQYTTAVQNLYVAYFNRPGDVAGVAYWEAAVAANGGSTSAISDAFATSSEYRAAYANMSSEEIINQIYVNLFGRAAEPAGRQYWADLLSSGQLKLSTIVADVANGAQSTDKTAFTAKSDAAIAFTNAMTSASKISSYSGEEALALARSYLSAVVDQASYSQAVTHASDVVLAMQAADSNPGNKIQYLTTSADQLLGSNTADLFLATVNSTGTSFDSTDSIDAGAGTDSLSIIATNLATYTAPTSVKLSNLENVSIVADGGVGVDSTAWSALTSLRVVASGAATLSSAAGNNLALVDILGNHSIAVNGGKNVNLALTAVGTGGAINVGASSAASGEVNLAAVLANGTSSNAVAASPITVNGGTRITIAQTPSVETASTTWQNAAVNVLGNASTTQVTSRAVVINSSINPNSVTISDVYAGDSSKVGTINTVTVGGASKITINDNALSSLNLANLSALSSSVTINNSGLLESATSSLALSLNNVKTSFADAGIYRTLNLKLELGSSNAFSALDAKAVTSLNVAGDGVFELPLQIQSLQSITTSGNAGVNFNGTSSVLSKIDSSASTGTSNISLNGTQTTYTGGAGIDNVSLLTSTVSVPIALGAGDDKLELMLASALPSVAVDGGSGTDTLRLYASDAISFASNGANNAAFANSFIGFEGVELVACKGTQSIDLLALGKMSNVGVATSGFAKNLSILNLPSGGMLGLSGDVASTFSIVNSAFSASASDALKLSLIGGASKVNAQVNVSDVESVNISLSSRENNPVTHTLTLTNSSLQSLTISGAAGLSLTATSSQLTSLDAQQLSLLGLNWTSGALAQAAAIKGALTVNNTLNLSAAKAAITYVGGSASDTLTLGAGAHTLSLQGGSDSVSLVQATSSLESFATITDARAGLVLSFLDKGSETFASSKISLASTASLQDYANAVVAAGADASVNAYAGWFQYANDTYYVQSQHNANVQAGFVGGVDFIIKLTGNVDLSKASFNGTGTANSLTIG